MGLSDSDTWFLESVDTPSETLQGQFVAKNVVENISNKYARHGSLNRSAPIIQFLSGEADTLSFQAKLFSQDAFAFNVEDDLKMLKKFAKRDSSLKRPPILHFWIGDGHLEMTQCIIESLGNITYEDPTSSGAVREVTLTVNLVRYSKFVFEESEPAETRYHRAKEREYYEYLAYYEYGNAMLGDVIRKRHPTKPTFQSGEIIKLPSIDAIRKDVVEPKSIALKTAYGKKTTPQRTLRLAKFDSRDREYVSHIVIE